MFKLTPVRRKREDVSPQKFRCELCGHTLSRSSFYSLPHDSNIGLCLNCKQKRGRKAADIEWKEVTHAADEYRRKKLLPIVMVLRAFRNQLRDVQLSLPSDSHIEVNRNGVFLVRGYAAQRIDVNDSGDPIKG